LTEPQRDAVFFDGRELAVVAGAGSGKTRVLVDRVLRLVLGLREDGTSDPSRVVDVDRMLVVTFTRAAAAELRDRLATELERAAQRIVSGEPEAEADRQARERNLDSVRRQRAAMPRAQISTIHSFCEQVIRRFGELRGIAPARVMDDDEAAELRHRLAVELLDRWLGPAAEPAVRETALAWGGIDGLGEEDLSKARGEHGLRPLVLALHDFRCSLPDPEAWARAHILRGELDPASFDARRPAEALLLGILTNWREHWTAIFHDEAEALQKDHLDAVHLQYLAQRHLVLARLSLDSAWDQIAAALSALTARQDGKDGRPALPHKQLLASAYRRDLPKDSLWYDRLPDNSKLFAGEVQELQAMLAAPWDEVAQRENAALARLKTLWGLARRFDTEYARYKRLRGLADFSDLERNALRVLTADEAEQPGGGPSLAALALRQQFEHVLVDEYQDVNELQDRIINLVTRDGADGGGRPRFVVGDVKQSIYRFRQADPRLFGRLVETLSPPQGEVLRLRHNFRSRPELLAAVNRIFSSLITPEFGGEDYARGSALEYGASYAEWFAAEGGIAYGAMRPRLHVLLPPTPPDGASPEESTDDPSAEAQDDAEDPDAEATLDEMAFRRVADVLREIHEERLGGQRRRVYDTEVGATREIAWRDCAVLLRSATGRMQLLRRALEQAGIPVYAPEVAGFFDRPEVSDVLSLLAVIDNPCEDIPLAAALRGPLGRLTPEELLIASRLANDGGPGPQSLWSRAQRLMEAGSLSADGTLGEKVAVTRGKLAQFAARLSHWRTLAREIPLPDLLWHLYTTEGLLAASAAQRGGEQRVTNLLELHESARAFARIDRPGLSRFRQYLEGRRLAKAEGGEPAVLGEGADVVRVLTVHKAKGLEFPVVVLPYMHARFNLSSSRGDVLWDEQEGTGGRLLDMAEGLVATGPGAPLPRRHETMRYWHLKCALGVQQREEELRLLYVAMTRARERLEVIAALSPDMAKQLDGQAPTPERARAPWDWLALQLENEIRRAIHVAPGWSSAPTEPATAPGTDASVPAQTGDTVAGSPWDVIARPAQAGSQEAEEALAAPEQAPAPAGTAEPAGVLDLAGIRRRLGFRYPYEGSSRLPSKVTVSELARRTREEEDASVEFPSERIPEHNQRRVTPQFMQPDRHSSGMDIGTLAHAVLARLDFCGLITEADVLAILEELRPGEELRRQVEELRLHVAAVVLQEHYDAFANAKVLTEVWVSLETAPDELPLSLRPPQHGTACHPSDRVLVQGAIDLLAVWKDRALVLDFKTDRLTDAETLRQAYSAQLAWYALAVRRLLPMLRPEAVKTTLFALRTCELIPVE
jgi:ATP-dependent helicase/nuclease subunit A